MTVAAPKHNPGERKRQAVLAGEHGDAAVALRLGVAPKTVAGWRHEFGIPPARDRHRAAAAGGSAAPTLDARFEARSRDHFDARPVPSSVLAVRPMPRISGSRGRLNAALAHLEGVAASQGIEVVAEDGSGVGWYDNGDRIIRMDPEVAADPALRAWVLAHELAHALDPRFVALGGAEYENDRRKRSDYEIVADAAARRAVMSFGLVVDGDDEYLSQQHPLWRQRIDGPLWDRWQSAALPLLRPAVEGSATAIERGKTYKRAHRRAQSEIKARIRDLRSEHKKQKRPSRGFVRLVTRLLFRRR